MRHPGLRDANQQRTSPARSTSGDLSPNMQHWMMMSWRRGIVVSPGAIDFFALTRSAPHSFLVSRATPNAAARRTWIITGIIILIGLVIGAIFCAVVLCFMYRKKQQRKKRNMSLSASNTTHQYRPIDDVELQYGGIQELPAPYHRSDHKAELSGAYGRVQQVDGFIAPPTPSAQPAELPSNNRAYKDEYR